VVRLDAAGRPGPVHTLSRARLSPTCPRVAVDSSGRAAVAWLGDENGSCANRVVQAVRLDSAGTPGPLQTLSRYSDACDSNPPPEPEVAVDDEGRATIVWSRFDGGGVQSVRLDAAGSPGPVLALSDASARFPQVAVDPDGRATVVWQRDDHPSEDIQAVRLDAAGNPGPIQILGAGRYPQVAVDAEGRATVVWGGVRAVRLDAAGNPGPVENFSEANRIADQPEVSVAPDGQATIVWRSRRSQRPRRTARVHAVRIDPAAPPAWFTP
jgi:hypothetical protein